MNAAALPADLMVPRVEDPDRRIAEPVDRALRRLRPLVGAALLFYLFGRSDEAPLGIPAPVLGALLVTLLAVLGRLAAAPMRRSGPKVRKAAEILAVAGDALVTVVVVTQFDLIDSEVSWALLLIPVLEGALRFRIRGVVTVWSGVMAAYVALQIDVPGNLSDPLTQAAFLDQIQTLIYRGGIILLVAVPGGYLSDLLLRAIGAQRRAQQAATRRNALLVSVVDAGKDLARWGVDVPQVVVNSAVGLGFDIADWAVIDDYGAWSALHQRPIGTRLALPAPDELCRQAAAEGRTLLAGGRDDDDRTRTLVASHHLEMMVACPIRGRDGTTAVLRVATRAGSQPSVQQIESLELLAGQAGVALDNDQLLSQLQEVQGYLEHQANHDPLTGLPNRLHFINRLAAGLEAIAETRAPLSILFIDLDRFKEVNDSLGHAIGDELLVAAAGRFRGAVRKEGLVARLGGDEFVAMLPDTDAAAASDVAARVVERLGRPFKLRKHDVTVGASVGVVSTSSFIDAGELMRRGDLAMYQAKGHGRSTWRLYSAELDVQSQARARIETELRVALLEGELRAEYQPVIRLADDAMVSVEALVRWTHPQLGPLSPDEFIAVAENSGLIEDLGQFMLETACAQARSWNDAHPEGDFTVSVNISPHQVRREGFVERVLAVLDDTGLERRHLVLELTERVLIGDEVSAPLHALRSHGVRIAVDDFGQGHASIGSLWKLPIDILKVDRAFVTDAPNDARRAAILKSMISLGHDMGMTVVAEGVETAEELAFLRNLGCDAVQGYHLHPPMAPGGVDALLGRPAPVGEIADRLPPTATPSRSAGPTREAVI